MLSGHKIPESVKYGGALLILIVLMIVVGVLACYCNRKRKARQWQLIPHVSVVGKPKITLEGEYSRKKVILHKTIEYELN
jgi:hypothetical protein